MQIFLPLPDIKESLDCLDKKRCWKQAVEAKQILDTITTGRKAWKNHPAVLMVKKYTPFLIKYYNTALIISTGKWEVQNKKLEIIYDDRELIYPPWFGDNRFHKSHRANLLRKDFEYYSKFNWIENNEDYVNTPYFWPTKEGY